MNGKNSFLGVIFAFLTAFFLFGALFFSVLLVMSLRPTVLTLVKKSDYSKKAALEAEERLEAVAQAGGFGDGFFDGVVTKNAVEKNLTAFINCSFSGKNFTADETVLRQKLNDKIFGAAEEKMSGYSAETRATLEQTVSLCVKEALSTAAPDVIGYLCRFSGRFKKTFAAAALIFSALFISAVFVLKKQSKRLIKTSLISAALMLSLAPFLALVFVKFENLGIESLALKDFLILFVLCLLAALIFAAVLVFVTAIFLRKKDPVSC